MTMLFTFACFTLIARFWYPEAAQAYVRDRSNP
jgi:hypothetical protein